MMADLYNQLQLVNWNIYLSFGLLSHRRNTKLVSDLSENGVRGLMGVTFLQRIIDSRSSSLLFTLHVGPTTWPPKELWVKRYVI